jgi:hypothetical protein
MSLTKLSLGGNYDVIYKLFLPRESLVSDIPAGDGNIENLFLRCNMVAVFVNSFIMYCTKSGYTVIEATFFTSILAFFLIVEAARGFAASREGGGANFSDLFGLIMVLWCYFFMYGNQFDHTSQKYL